MKILKYKDNQGNWVSVPALIGPKGDQGIQGEKGDRGDTVIIASKYSELTFPVAEGTYCLYNDVPYVANQTISTSEAWTAAHWDQVSFEDEIGELKNALQDTNDAVGTIIEPHLVYSGNVIDLSEATIRSSLWLTEVAEFVMDDGTYYKNPIASGEIALVLYPKDANGNAIQMTVNGSTTTQIGQLNPNYVFKFVVDGLTITATRWATYDKFIANIGSTTDVYTLASRPDHWVCGGKASALDSSLNMGLTKGSYSAEYVAYVTPTKEYTPTGLLEELAPLVGIDSVVSEHGNELEMLAKKSLMVESGTQVVDLSNAIVAGSGSNLYWKGVKIYLPCIGKYYFNPNNLSLGLTYGKMYNANGDLVTFRKNAQSSTAYLEIGSGNYFEVADPRTILEYNSSDTLVNVWEASDDIAYIGDTNCRIEYFDDNTLKVGITFGSPSTAYVEFDGMGDAIETYAYNKAIAEYVDHINSRYEPSYNLIDTQNMLWETVDGYWRCRYGYYFPVTGGKKICSNAAKIAYQFYDSTKTFISQDSTINSYTIVQIPANATLCSIFINSSGNTLSELRENLVVYEVPSEMESSDDIRPYVPPLKIKKEYVEGDIYESAFPTSLELDILNAAQYKAVRALNHQRNAFRVGTFNIYVPRGRYHWELLKKELKDFSVDMCGFQEVANTSDGSRILQNFLTTNNWQFAYGSQAEFDGTYIDKTVVSAYEIASTDYYITSTDVKYIKTVVNLPQYKHIDHQFTLSIYNYHGSVVAANRLTEVSEILETIASDTSDFIIIIGDTNAFASEADAQGKRPTWEAWKAAGFTPVHYGESPTTGDGHSIDQIFVGANVTCLYYDVVDSNRYKLTISGSEVPISDHDFVYADLQFDFDAVLAELNTNA